MDLATKEFFISRIISGEVIFKFKDKEYIIRAFAPHDRYRASILYNEKITEGKENGIMSDDDVLAMMMNEGIWSEDMEQKMLAHEENIENFKIGLVDNMFRSDAKAKIKNLLIQAKEEYGKFNSLRHSFDHVSVSGYAFTCKMRYLIANSIHTVTGTKIFSDDSWYVCNPGLIERGLIEYQTAKLSEEKIRDLARTDPWRIYWTCSKSESQIFNSSVVEWTDEQRILALWSKLYDNVYDAHDSPSNEIIEDDDALDGWLIKKRKQRESDSFKRFGDSLLAKHTNADEIYVPVNSFEDAKKLSKLNSDIQQGIKKQRLEYLSQKGEVKEICMPDTAQRLQMAVVQKFSKQVKG